MLHRVVSQHLLTFLEQAADTDPSGDGVGLPAFVERELRGFVDCGVLAKGFARLRCDACAFERLVPFSQGSRLLPELRRSSHGRARRPSGRRGVARRAHPSVGAQPAAGTLTFHPLPPPSDEEVARLVATIRKRVLRLLVREGMVEGDGDSAADTSARADPGRSVSPALAALASASLRGVRAFGSDAGTPLLRIGRDPDAPWVCSRTSLQARLDGFDLHAAVTVPAGNAEAREDLCRYLLRPAVAQERLELCSDGQVQLELKTP